MAWCELNSTKIIIFFDFLNLLPFLLHAEEALLLCMHIDLVVIQCRMRCLPRMGKERIGQTSYLHPFLLHAEEALLLCMRIDLAVIQSRMKCLPRLGKERIGRITVKDKAVLHPLRIALRMCSVISAADLSTHSLYSLLGL